MEEQTIFECINCKEKIDIDVDDYACVEDGFLCYGCKESDEERASTYVKFSPEGKQAFLIGRYVAYETENGEDEPAQEALELFSRPIWHKTDPWRGYDETKPLKENMFINIGAGWITGFPDESTQRKIIASDIYEMLNNECKANDGVPFTLWWIFSTTSNVFSTAVDMYLLKEDEEAFKNWLKEKTGKTVEDIDYALS